MIMNIESHNIRHKPPLEATDSTELSVITGHGIVITKHS